MTKKQINVRVSPAIEDMIRFLTEKYGSITNVIEVAVSLLYTQYINSNSPVDRGEGE